MEKSQNHKKSQNGTKKVRIEKGSHKKAKKALKKSKNYWQNQNVIEKVKKSEKRIQKIIQMSKKKIGVDYTSVKSSKQEEILQNNHTSETPKILHSRNVSKFAKHKINPHKAQKIYPVKGITRRFLI